MSAPLDLDAIEKRLGDAHDEDHIEDLIAELRRLREAERWVPVSERLPEHDTLVLVFRPDHGLAQELYFGDGKFVHVNMREARDVTHWRVMPAGPTL